MDHLPEHISEADHSRSTNLHGPNRLASHHPDDYAHRHQHVGFAESLPCQALGEL